MGQDQHDTPTSTGSSSAADGVADSAEARQHRLDALRGLAQGRVSGAASSADAAGAEPQTASGSAPTARRAPVLKPRGRAGWWWGALVMVVILAVVAAFTLPNLLRKASPKAQASVLTITPYADDLACPVDVAWSPNGRLLAVLGFHLSCPNMSSTRASPGQVNIYDATTGKLVQQFQPDTLILHGHGVTLSTATQTAADGSTFVPFIGYTALVWSPDGQRLALPFVALQSPYTLPATDFGAQTGSPAQATTVGVLLIDVAGRQARVLAAPYRLPAVAGGAYGAYRSSVEWDLTSGALASSNLTLPAALGYQWGAQGSLLPLGTLTTTGAPTQPALAPVGNPIGGKTFTIWQPGLADQGFLPIPPNATQPATPQAAVGVYFWATRFPIWSPDGRYLIAPANYGGRVLGAIAPVPTIVTEAGQTQTVVLPTRDAALQNLIQPDVFAPVAWSPDGRVMASVGYAFNNAGAITVEKVNLTDAATGSLLKSLTLHTTSTFTPATGADGLGPTSDFRVFLRWSADGARLAVMDANRDGVITIWGAGAVPRV